MSTIEVLYYLTGGPALTVIALFGLWQLVLAQKNLTAAQKAIEVAQEDLAQRVGSEKTRLAVDMCLRFADDVLPLIEEANKCLSDKLCPQAPAGLDPWEFESYGKQHGFVWRPNEQVKKVIRALNAMEAVAIPLARGAADAGLAADSIGVSFVEAASRFAFIVAAIREQKPNAFPAVRALHDEWRS